MADGGTDGRLKVSRRLSSLLVHRDVNSIGFSSSVHSFEKERIPAGASTSSSLPRNFSLPKQENEKIKKQIYNYSSADIETTRKQNGRKAFREGSDSFCYN